MLKMLGLIVVVLTLLPLQSVAQDEVVASPIPESAELIRVAVYRDKGTGRSVSKLMEVLDQFETVEVREVTAEQVRNGALDEVEVLIHPGGSGGGQGRHLGSSGREAVRAFVRGGGGYVGICAGAYLASADYEWSLHILDAKVLDRAHWARGHGNVEIGITEAGQDLLRTDQSKMTILYWQGPLLAPADVDEVEDYNVIASFETEIAENGAPQGVMIGTTAIASGEFGRGRVICFSPHPELTEGLEPLIMNAIDHVRRKADH